MPNLGYVLCVEHNNVNDEVFQGLPILCLFAGSVAERAGVKVGDHVLFANGVRVSSYSDYVNARSIYNDRLELTLRRGNQIIDTVVVFKEPDGVPADPKQPLN
jgi:predicted metalloprotease with PDZ domain